MKILMISPEIAPFSKTGGLGDAVAAMTKFMAAKGHEVRVFTPAYGFVKRDENWKKHETPIRVGLGYGMTAECAVYDTKFFDATVSFVEYNYFFGGNDVYSSRPDDAHRFAFFNKAAIDFCEQINWIPEIVHCHDWTTGLVPALLNTRERWRRIARAGIVFTIHNLQHQGFAPKSVFEYLGLPWNLFTADNYEALGGVNMMKGALYHSTKITTVSPTYAYEIQTQEHGFGLEHVLQHRSRDLAGIINGIDYGEWSPKTDKLIPANFDEENFAGKDICKAELQRESHLPQKKDVPVFGIVSRLAEQKGLDLLAAAIPNLLQRAEMQIVLLGSGNPWLESTFKRLAARFPTKLAVSIGYNNRLAHLIEAGSDFFVMPSRFEPCGLNQMYSMTYGTPPIVRTTGGLVDTVRAWEPQNPSAGTGINFHDSDVGAMIWAIERALKLYFDHKADYLKVRKNGMKQDFSWDRSVSEYEKIYKDAIEARKNAFPKKAVPEKKIVPEAAPEAKLTKDAKIVPEKKSTAGTTKSAKKSTTKKSKK